MIRDDLIDACVYGGVNANPGFTPRGLQYLFRGFTVAEVKTSLERLAVAGMVTPTAGGATTRLDVQWFVVKAP